MPFRIQDIIIHESNLDIDREVEIEVIGARDTITKYAYISQDRLKELIDFLTEQLI